MQFFGALLVSFLLGYLAVLAAQLRRQFASARCHEEQSLELLKTQIEAATRLRDQRQEEQLAWLGFRDFQVHGTVSEAKNITSLYLFPHDRKPLPGFQPGQSLTLRVILPGEDEPIERRFPVSSSPSSDFYRITVQRTAGDPVSDYLHNNVNQHTILKVGAPGGNFCIDTTLYRPLAMIAEGVGVAPFVSMIEHAVETGSRRSITLFHSVRDASEHAMGHHLKALEGRYHNLEVVTIFQDADDHTACDHSGPVTVDLLRSVLHSNNFEFYVCGPAGMVSTTASLLRQWGVSRWNVATEVIDGVPENDARGAFPTEGSIPGGSVPGIRKAPGNPSVVAAIRSAVMVADTMPATKTTAGIGPTIPSMT